MKDKYDVVIIGAGPVGLSYNDFRKGSGEKIINPQYNCPEISKILKIKRNHEYFSKKINFLNNILPNFGFKIMSFF